MRPLFACKASRIAILPLLPSRVKSQKFKTLAVRWGWPVSKKGRVPPPGVGVRLRFYRMVKRRDCAPCRC